MPGDLLDKCCLDLRYFWKLLWNKSQIHKIFEENLCIGFQFFLQILSKNAFRQGDIIKIVRCFEPYRHEWVNEEVLKLFITIVNFSYLFRSFLDSRPEGKLLVSNHKCNYYKAKFSHKIYFFGGQENTTFFVYIYDFQTPFWLQISFSQFPKIDLVQFFITFFR